MFCAERKRFVKNCGLLTGERVGDNIQKISPILAKRTDFLVYKAQVLVGVTGFEPSFAPIVFQNPLLSLFQKIQRRLFHSF